MRVNDVGFVLVNRWGDFVTKIRPNHYSQEEIDVVTKVLGGVELRQLPIRLLPETIPGEQLGQAAMDAIMKMDLLDVDGESCENIADHRRAGGSMEDRPGVVFTWKGNSDEQIGATIKGALGSMQMRFDE